MPTRRSTGERGLRDLRRVGHAGCRVVDPVGADVIRTVARSERIANARLLPLRLRGVVDGRAQRNVLEPVVEVVRERSGEDVRVLRRVGDAPAGDRLVRRRRSSSPATLMRPAARMHEAREQVRDVVLAALVAADERDVLAGDDRERKAVDRLLTPFSL